MNDNILKRIIEHPDKDEIISKLIAGIEPSDIYNWLASKYTGADESRLIITAKQIQIFQKNYLDTYKVLREDFAKTQESLTTKQKAELTVKNNSAYKKKLLDLANKEVDIKQMIANMVVAIEERAAQVFDSIQDNPTSFKNDRILMEWFDRLGTQLSRYHSLIIAPPEAQNTINNNITLNIVDQHIGVFHDTIKEILVKMDVQTSLQFMEIFNNKMAKLKEAMVIHEKNTDARLEEVKLLNETINNRLNNE